MKHFLVGLAALLMVSLALAGEAIPAGREQAAEAKSTQAKSSKKKPPRAGKRPLPGGDLSHCLELKSNEEIIKCAEGR
jgi:hypothetical protein